MPNPDCMCECIKNYSNLLPKFLAGHCRIVLTNGQYWPFFVNHYFQSNYPVFDIRHQYLVICSMTAIAFALGYRIWSISLLFSKCVYLVLFGEGFADVKSIIQFFFFRLAWSPNLELLLKSSCIYILNLFYRQFLVLGRCYDC